MLIVRLQSTLETIRNPTGNGCAIFQVRTLATEVTSDPESLFSHGGIGYSQMNEILLLLGYDRITDAFFQYIVDGQSSYIQGSAIDTVEQFRLGVDRFRKHAMLRWGNIKYAFKYLSSLASEELHDEIGIIEPIDDTTFGGRHEPVRPIDPISGEETYYLGYIIERELKERLDANPHDKVARDGLAKREEIVARGMRNNEAYLASDHMDVYVATSMRERLDFYVVNSIVSKVFNHDTLSPLKPRWFDPTQAYCHDRIDKGLSEALMLKRAKCTLYLAQETDTLGKDSELASTLAQGKPVIAFIPRIEESSQQAMVKWLLQVAKKLYPQKDPYELLRDQLKVFAPHLAWQDTRVREWIADPRTMSESDVQRLLGSTIRDHYESRARTLQQTHPLGVQVHLDTGVANGVLVARTTDECAELIHRVLCNRLEFTIEEKSINGKEYLLLKESVSNSVFRVVTGDAMLTNTFWNFYLT